ncbi:MAG: hypothetical protein MZV63_26965 [Marinilabiliales bacterium]|nr:hypothetical protein [Marinilabiliales bacterium]
MSIEKLIQKEDARRIEADRRASRNDLRSVFNVKIKIEGDVSTLFLKHLMKMKLRLL